MGVFLPGSITPSPSPATERGDEGVWGLCVGGGCTRGRHPRCLDVVNDRSGEYLTCKQARQMLQWYTYRWRVEEYHKLLKSGCQAERYRMGAPSIKTCLGLLCVIAVELLRVTYLHRTQPDGDITLVLNETQQDVLKAKAQSQGIAIPPQLSVGWGIEQVARLGGYLEHRRKTPIGIQVLWRGWLTLHGLCEGWELASSS